MSTVSSDLDAAQHFAGRLVGEGQEQDPRRVHPRLDPARHPVDEGARLPGACPGDDQDRAAAGQDDLALLVVQLPVVVDPVDPGSDRLSEDVTALHVSSLRLGPIARRRPPG